METNRRETDWSEAVGKLAQVVNTYQHIGTTADQVFIASESLWANWGDFNPTGPDWLQGFEEAMDEVEMRYAAESFLKVRSLLKERYDLISESFNSGDDMVLGELILELADGIYSLIEGPETPDKTSDSIVIEGEKLLETLLEANGLMFPQDEDLQSIDLNLISDPGEREILRELISSFEAITDPNERSYGETLYLLLSRIFIVHWSFYRSKF
ncbi:hypothetical protein CH373_03275 [Leptospira perolatii]|uniref:Uncharacterized protein n=2 Tax=Leptospira perolatii TaxID=2023191 RepID=A0A2M9ZT17_9LEPT|nr:hypothetical protein CH360_03270 [Leptospira perolatii]PJZ75230.1 hypothetical protein CH373_03275 [Leptospira perolatii]